MKNIIVYVEQKNAQTRKVTFELATEAGKLASALGGKAHAVIVGPGASKLAETLKTYPLDAIHVNDDADVEKFLIDPAVDYLEAAAKAIGPSLILIPNTLSGRDVAGRLLARLGAGIGADVTDFKIENGKVECISPKMGGALITTCELKPADYAIATVRPNAFTAAAGGAGAQVQPLEKPAGKTYGAVIEKDVDEESSGEMALEEAPVVIAGGRGLGGPEPFDTLLKPLAHALGGAVGASRAAADAGWVSYSLQIGQTGKTVSPNLYIGVGISGAIQHKVGMRAAGTIVAINKDGAAPIADFSDLLVVGDAFQIVPELTKLIEAAKH